MKRIRIEKVLNSSGNSIMHVFKNKLISNNYIFIACLAAETPKFVATKWTQRSNNFNIKSSQTIESKLSDNYDGNIASAAIVKTLEIH